MRSFVWIFAVFPLAAQAYDAKVAGFVAVEMRGFTSDAQFDDQFNGIQPSLIVQPEIRSQSDSGRDQYSFIPFVRLDSRDDRRTHGDLREAYWQHIEDQWTLLIGVNRVFWGVAESNHLVDIINQTDLVEDIDGEDKLGQPMFNSTGLGESELLYYALVSGTDLSSRRRAVAFPAGSGGKCHV